MAKKMPEGLKLVCKTCGEQASGPDAADVRAAMARHEAKKGHKA